MDAYLFVHFKEKQTPDGEQVYFALSKDGLNWESVNDGEPVLWSNKGEKGVRDHTIYRSREGKFYIISTDLSLSNCFKTKYKGDWGEIGRNGSKYLVMWESDDLINWSEQKMIKLGDEDYGCIWAPDIIYDRKSESYMVHFSVSHASNNYGNKAIYYTLTKDFKTFTNPKVLCRKDDSGIIDSAIYEDKGTYYRFLKSENNPHANIMQKGKTLTGEYETIKGFDEEIQSQDKPWAYEGATAYKLHDGRWCLMLDYFGVQGEGQGYVPFITDNIDSGKFVRAEEEFSFPYHFKHGTVLSITNEEYIRIMTHWKL